MKKQTAALSSFVEQSTERMDKLTAAVKQGLLDNLHLMQTASENLYRTSDYQTALLSYAITLENAIQLVQTKYAELLMAIETLINGHLSPFLVPAETLNATLYDIQAHLRSRGRYSLIYTTPGWYFHRSSFVYAREKETLFITIQIPLTTFQTIPIPFITAFHLRTLLLNPFECYPLWVRHGERLRIEVAKPQDPEPQPEPPNNA